VVICLEQGADLHMPQLMSLPLTVSCFSKIQIGFTCVCVRARACVHAWVRVYHPSYYYYTHTHTHTFYGPLSRTTQLSRYRESKTNLDFTEARDNEWQ